VEKSTLYHQYLEEKYMIKSFLTVIVFLIVVITASPSFSQAGKLSQKLSGTWANDVMTARIDLSKGTCTGIRDGQSFTHSVKVLKEAADFLIVEVAKADGSPMKATIQFLPDGGIAIIHEGDSKSVKLMPKKD
jgi:uncharacterized protein YpmB